MSDHSLMQWALPSIPISIAFPPLPTIQDHALERQVFTHTSYHQMKRNPTSFDVDSTQRTGQDNEKLEHIGDALLGMSHVC
jgi:dsRNA-specific ribonuclease